MIILPSRERDHARTASSEIIEQTPQQTTIPYRLMYRYARSFKNFSELHCLCMETKDDTGHLVRVLVRADPE